MKNSFAGTLRTPLALRTDPKHVKEVLQNLVGAKDMDKDPKQRKGHWICLDQSGDVDQIEIYDHTQEHYMLIDTKNKKITITTKPTVSIRVKFTS